MKNLTLITGGVRSGKSRLAETLAENAQKQVYYLATMQRIVDDQEQDVRIDRHRSRRPNTWETVECPYKLNEAIMTLPADGGSVLIDCLSLFITNLMLKDETLKSPYDAEDFVLSSVDAVLLAIGAKPEFEFIVVTNEVGWGVVPETPLGRAFRDFLGIANQKFAHGADNVIMTCSGIPLRLKPTVGSFTIA